MKNIFKFNRVFSVILLLSVVTNASAVRFDFDSPCFNSASANFSTTAPVVPAVTVKVPVAASVAEVSAPAVTIEVPVAAPISRGKTPEQLKDILKTESAPAVTETPAIEVSAPAVTIEVPVAAPVSRGKTPEQLKDILKTESALAVAETPAIEVSAPAVVAAAEAAAETALDAANANLMAGFGVSEGHIKAEAPVATQVSNVTVEVPVAAPVASGSRLSEAGRVAKLHYQMALDKLTAQENRKTVYAVAGIAAACAVGYGIYKYFSAKSAAPVAAISGESATMPVIGQTATTTEATPTRQAPVMITTHKRLLGTQTVIKTPVNRDEYQALLNNYKVTKNKAILTTIQSSFSSTGKEQAGIVRVLGSQFKVKNNADAILAKLAELIAAS